MIVHIENEKGEKLIDIKEHDLDGDKILIKNANGFGATDVVICCHNMTWEQVDQLKKGIKMAEDKWRK